MGLHPVIRENIKLCLFESPTTVQSYAIPAIILGRDLIGIAQTGTYNFPYLPVQTHRVQDLERPALFLFLSSLS